MSTSEENVKWLEIKFVMIHLLLSIAPSFDPPNVTSIQGNSPKQGSTLVVCDILIQLYVQTPPISN